MNNIIRKIVRKTIKYFIPEIEILSLPYYWEDLKLIKVNCETGKNVVINPKYCIINSKIGDYTYIASNSALHNTTIGKFCSIGPNIISGYGIHPTNGLSTAPMFYSTLKQNGLTLTDKNKIDEWRAVEIGNDVFIGANVTILDGVKIGDGAIVGAGAVVSKDIPPYAIAVGSPIRIIKFRFDENQVNDLLRIKWWDFSENKLEDVEKYFFDVEKFIKKYGY